MRFTRLAIASSLMVFAGLLVAPAAHADPACGDTIMANTTLTGDVGPCADNGIKVGANDVVLNLNGYTIFGTPDPGDGAGVLVAGHTGVTVRNGTVKGFDGGVVIRNGGGNTVKSIIAKQNIGNNPAQPLVLGVKWGDGIAVEGSSDNTLLKNTTQNNGPFSGIGLYEVPDGDHPFNQAPTTNNLVKGNTVLDNVSCRHSGFCDNDGVRVEPAVSPGNTILTNRVERNALDGIALFGFVSGTMVSQNTVKGNGYKGAVTGDGIRVFGYNNTIFSNISTGNAQDGISVAKRSIAPPGSFPPPNGRDNKLTFNTATGNLVHDLYDSNTLPDCDNNTWANNTFVVAFPTTCIA